MRHKFISDISANTVQVAINQCCGLLIFYILSLGLSKDLFGELNWTLAVLLTLFGILSFGIDQVAVRRIAAGGPAHLVLSLYLGHTLYWGLGAYALLALAQWCFPDFFAQHHLLLWIGIGKLGIFLASPFKQVANGLEKFRPLLYMSTFSNILRALALLTLYLLGQCHIGNVVTVFIAGDIAEWLLCYAVVRWHLRVPIKLRFHLQAYRALIKEAAPQLLSVILTAGLARLDWILIGIFCTTGIVANYSFAWKAFEATTLPLLVLGPVLLARFSRIFAGGSPQPTAGQMDQLMALLRTEMVVASGSALLLNLLWAPLIDAITKGSYGAVNSTTILWLSLSLPLLYLNNFLWTINFARHRMRIILLVVAITFAVNAGANLWLIPQFDGAGAAAAFLAATVVQAFLYVWATPLVVQRTHWLPVFIAPGAAVVAGWVAHYFFAPTWAVISSAMVLYLLLLLVLGQVKRSDWLLLRRASA
jgi:O-antigen/teichoic acid export membrane protein